MIKKCTIQTFVDDAWQDTAMLTLSGAEHQGWAASTYGGYLLEHILAWQGRRDAHACSYHWPVDAEVREWPTWPAFLIDLLPQGFGRQELLRQLGLPQRDSQNNDWALLLAGAGNPIGSMRIKEAYEWLAQHRPAQPHGFSKDAVARRHEDFVEYLADHGLFVAGSSGVQGEWPKILLTEATDGLLYLDHLLPDEQARQHWLVKFSRVEQPALHRILEAEGRYMECARHLGLRVHALPVNHAGALFIPRFDRHTANGKVQRIAQESLASLCQRAGFGIAVTHNDACSAIAQATTVPLTEVIEYLKRDVANVVRGNKDNHARNTAIQRDTSGHIRLTPLYDFATMYLHPDGIARLSRWRQDDHGGQPDWLSAANQAALAANLPLEPLLDALKELAVSLATLGDVMTAQHIDPEIIDRVTGAANKTAATLRAL